MEFLVSTNRQDISESLYLTTTKAQRGLKQDLWLRLGFIAAFFGLFFYLGYVLSQTQAVYCFFLMFLCLLINALIYLPVLYRQIAAKRAAQVLAKLTQYTVKIDAHYIATVTQDPSQNLKFAWHEIKELIISDRLYVFITKPGVGLYFNRQYIPDEAALTAIIESALKAEQIAYRKS